MSLRLAVETPILIDFINLNKHQQQQKVPIGAGDVAERQMACPGSIPSAEIEWVGKMDERLRALPALAEDPGLVPGGHIMWPTTATTC